MFDAFTPWTWVWLAWGELLLAYLGYAAYLGWRRRRLERRAAHPDTHLDTHLDAHPDVHADVHADARADTRADAARRRRG